LRELRPELRPVAATPVNRDFAPVAYYFDIVLWSTQFKEGHSNWLRTAARIGFMRVMAAILVLLLLMAIVLAIPIR